MDTKQFNKINRIIAACVAVLASLVYLATIEPTTSFWDCGEFIASSYKLEVGHAPGNPVFNLFARIFTLFTDAGHAAVAVNAMSALCSGSAKVPPIAPVNALIIPMLNPSYAVIESARYRSICTLQPVLCCQQVVPNKICIFYLPSLSLAGFVTSFFPA